MLKKVMLWVMAFMTAQRFFGVTVSLATHQQNLPLLVYCVSGSMAIYGLAIVMMSLKRDISMKTLSLYYVTLALSVCANLILMKTLSWVDVTLLDFAVIGTCADFVACAAMLLASMREKRYVQVRMKQTVQ